MRFDLTADQRLLQSATAEFLEKFCPVSEARALGEAGRAFEREAWRRGAGLGWASLLVPAELGGRSVSGAGPVDAAIMAAQVGWGAPPEPFPAAPAAVAAPAA